MGRASPALGEEGCCTYFHRRDLAELAGAARARALEADASLRRRGVSGAASRGREGLLRPCASMGLCGGLGSSPSCPTAPFSTLIAASGLMGFFRVKRPIFCAISSTCSKKGSEGNFSQREAVSQVARIVLSLSPAPSSPRPSKLCDAIRKATISREQKEFVAKRILSQTRSHIPSACCRSAQWSIAAAVKI